MIMQASETDSAAEPSSHYLQLLFRGGLSMPSNEIKHYVCNSFAIIGLVEDTMRQSFLTFL